MNTVIGSITLLIVYAWFSVIRRSRYLSHWQSEARKTEEQSKTIERLRNDKNMYRQAWKCVRRELTKERELIEVKEANQWEKQLELEEESQTTVNNLKEENQNLGCTITELKDFLYEKTDICDKISEILNGEERAARKITKINELVKPQYDPDDFGEPNSEDSDYEIE
jgi:hypothetical protein